jgi:tetratricopeptide (TPR) repeat protein
MNRAAPARPFVLFLAIAALGCDGGDRHRAGYELSVGYRAVLQRDFPTAVQHFDRAIALDPLLAEARHGRAGALEALGQLDAAIAEYGNWIRIEPRSADAYALRGNAYGRRGSQRRDPADLRRAVNDFKTAQRMASSGSRTRIGQAELHRGAARALLALGRNDEAAEEVKSLRALAPDDPRSTVLVAQALANEALTRRGTDAEKSARRRAALREVDASLERLPASGRGAFGRRALLWLRSQLRRAEGDLDAAQADLETLLEMRPDDPNILDARASIHEERGDVKAAEADRMRAERVRDQGQER